MRTYTDSPDPRGVDEVPKLAREFGRVGKEALEQSERTRSEMYTWYDRADDFSYSDGVLRPSVVETDSPLYKGYKSVMIWASVKPRKLDDEVFTLAFMGRVEELRR
jgi:hypothetical protein